MWMVLFLVLPILGLAYTLWHIWCILPFGGMWRGAVVAACILAFAALPVIFSRAIEDLPLNIATACYEVGNSVVFVLLYAVMAFLLLDLGRLAHIVPRPWLYANAYSACALAAALAATFTYGYLNYRHKVRQPIELTTAKHIGGEVKVVMMSDLHLGYHNRRKELARWVDMVNAERPDLLAVMQHIHNVVVRQAGQHCVAKVGQRLAGSGQHTHYPLFRLQYCARRGLRPALVYGHNAAAGRAIARTLQPVDIAAVLRHL